MTDCFSFPLLSRLDSEDDQETEKLQRLHSKTASRTPEEGPNDNNESTKTEEPNTSQLGPTECKYKEDYRRNKICSTLEVFLFISRLHYVKIVILFYFATQLM